MWRASRSSPVGAGSRFAPEAEGVGEARLRGVGEEEAGPPSGRPVEDRPVEDGRVELAAEGSGEAPRVAVDPPASGAEGEGEREGLAGEEEGDEVDSAMMMMMTILPRKVPVAITGIN